MKIIIIRWSMTLMLFVLPVPIWAMSSLPSNLQEDDLVGKIAPEFTLDTIHGAHESLTQARAGKRAMVFFWATWCPHCDEELKVLAPKLGSIKQQDIQVVLVDVGESREDVKAFLAQRHLPLDSFLDEDNTVAGRYSVIGIPTIIFIDEKGFIRAIEHEFPSDYETRFDSK